MSNDAFESCMFLKLDGGSMKMIEALQTHLALEYEFFETPADIVESAIFEMYIRANTTLQVIKNYVFLQPIVHKPLG